MSSLAEQLQSTLNRLCKWRMVYAGWQLGTRAKTDPEAQAVRDHREGSLLLRVETTAIIRLLLEKKLITQAELQAAMIAEAEHLDKAHEVKFPGFRSTDSGMIMDVEVTRETTKGWRK